jgi:hypothetical protein
MALMLMIRMRQFKRVFYGASPLLLPDGGSVEPHAIAFKSNVKSPRAARARVRRQLSGLAKRPRELWPANTHWRHMKFYHRGRLLDREASAIDDQSWLASGTVVAVHYGVPGRKSEPVDIGDPLFYSPTMFDEIGADNLDLE